MSDPLDCQWRWVLGIGALIRGTKRILVVELTTPSCKFIAIMLNSKLKPSHLGSCGHLFKEMSKCPTVGQRLATHSLHHFHVHSYHRDPWTGKVREFFVLSCSICQCPAFSSSTFHTKYAISLHSLSGEIALWLMKSPSKVGIFSPDECDSC